MVPDKNVLRKLAEKEGPLKNIKTQTKPSVVTLSEKQIETVNRHLQSSPAMGKKKWKNGKGKKIVRQGKSPKVKPFRR